ncbi:MAG: hypothetical protein FWC12_08590 [Treponema sp.]|nr:hypothetical protein [Treponema sp.]
MLPNHNEINRIYLSLKFDDHSKSIAFELEKFFKLLGIEMISGLGVEPRSISEKVFNKLKMDINMFVILITKTGTSDWINQEIGVAKEKGLSTLIIKNENFTKFKSGLLSDNEYITYEDNISEAYIGILEAINYLKICDIK